MHFSHETSVSRARPADFMARRMAFLTNTGVWIRSGNAASLRRARRPGRLAPSRPGALRSSIAQTASPSFGSKYPSRYNLRLRMRRPTRTRRLSIAAMASLLAFVVAAAAGVRSFWISDTWIFANCQSEIVLSSGSVTGARIKSVGVEGFDRSKHLFGRVAPDKHKIARAIWGFHAWRIVLPHRSGVREEISALDAPLWSLLLLLLIAPARWLLARPANASAFPVIARAKQVYVQINEQ
jgi:hypothetical protein